MRSRIRKTIVSASARGLLSLIVAVFLLASARSAWADDDPKSPAALEHLAKGNKLYNLREFVEAAEEYKAGALVEPAPAFDYNLGQCYRQSHDYKAAIWHFQRYLKTNPGSSHRIEASNKFIAEMQAELNQQAMKEPPTEPAAATPAPTSVPTASASTPTVPNPLSVTASPVVERWYEDWFGWGLSGAGMIALGVGGGLLLDASSLYDDANHTSNQAEATSLRDKGDQRQLLGAVIGIGGAGLLVTGVIKLAIHPSASENARTARTWNVGASSRSVFVRGTF
jgi:tetratricopeptide (TPR) repeat protein